LKASNLIQAEHIQKYIRSTVISESYLAFEYILRKL